jgi:phosphoribosylglycinamide formyltransferase-1
MQDRIRLAVSISGRGANLQALIEAAQQPDYPAKLAIVLSDKPDAGALKRAREAGMPAYPFPADSRTAFACIGQVLISEIRRFGLGLANVGEAAT